MKCVIQKMGEFGLMWYANRLGGATAYLPDARIFGSHLTAQAECNRMVAAGCVGRWAVAPVTNRGLEEIAAHRRRQAAGKLAKPTPQASKPG
jgi:hypothetical protein